MRTRLAALAALLLLACSGLDQRSPDISIGNGWTREIAPGQSAAAVYVTIVNRGEGGDRLVDADAPTAGAATLHSSSSSGGVARMRAIEDGVEIPAHSTIELEPGGIHIMLTGLKGRLSAGQTLNLRLGFARSGRRSIAVRVVPAAADNVHAEHEMTM
jgi:copper(I)-binding protein